MNDELGTRRTSLVSPEQPVLCPRKLLLSASGSLLLSGLSHSMSERWDGISVK